MFLHIGNNVLLKKSEVIGIFCIDSLLKDAKGRKFLNEVKHGKEYEDISEGKWSSLIMTNDKMYISRISSATLLGRSQADLKDMLSGAEAKIPGGEEEKEFEPTAEELEAPMEEEEE